MEPEAVRERTLDAAAELFYRHGVQAVGMDAVRARAEVSLKRLYQLFPSKDALVCAYLERRDTQWLDRLRRHGSGLADPRERVLAVFDWLAEWFGEEDFRGCAFVNAFGELGSGSPAVAEVVRRHKEAFHAHLAELVTAAGQPADLAHDLTLLAEGAMTTAAISGSPEPAAWARSTAQRLLR